MLFRSEDYSRTLFLPSESFRFRDEDESEIFPILSSARANRENVIAIVILLRVLARMSCIIERSSVESFTSFNGNKRSNFCGEKKYDEAFRVSIFRE